MESSEQTEILLVEDNALEAELTMLSFKDQKVADKITWVKDGQQALDYVFRCGAYEGRMDASPRLILLDLKMPRVDGTEVLRAVKADERTRRIPVIIMTSSNEESDIAHTYELGANSYVVKPMNFDSLAEVTRQIGLYWLVINQR